jgi:hypothetical protein
VALRVTVVKVVVSQLERDRARHELLIAQLCRDAGDEEQQHGLELVGVAHVGAEGGFPAHSIGQAVAAEDGAAPAVCPELEAARLVADQPGELRFAHLLHLPYVVEAQGCEPPCRGRTDARHGAERQAGEETLFPPVRTSMSPRGFAASDASFATMRFGPMPMLTSSSASRRTVSRIDWATGRSDTGCSRSVPGKSR